MSATERTKLGRLPSKVHEEITQIAKAERLPFDQAFEIWVNAGKSNPSREIEVSMKEDVISEPKSSRVLAQGSSASLNLGDDPALKEPQGLSKGMTTELLEFGYRVGQENAELRRDVQAMMDLTTDLRAGVIALGVGQADHLTQHEQGDITPQLTRDAMMNALAEAKFKGNRQNTAKVLEQAFGAGQPQTGAKALEEAAKPAQPEVA